MRKDILAIFNEIELHKMSIQTENNKRIAKNTLMLYIRMFLVMGVNLYTSRIILNALGINDYGIYNVVGGIVSLFSIISGSLSSAISRFITFELGTGDITRLKRIFATSISIQLFISFVVLLICGTLGFWFLNNRMNIDPERMVAANWVLLFSLFTFVINLLSVPYNAAIVAHEKMSAFAYISVIEVLLRLGVAYLILIFNSDRLILYAGMIMGISVIIRILYGIYCSRKFDECRCKPNYDRAIFKEMSGFAGWNFIGTSSSVIRDQGNNIVLNLFFGTVVNAAYGIGMQVGYAINSFSQNFMTAINPQITKSYATKEWSYLNNLIIRGSRFSYYLLWIVSSFVLLNTDQILFLWLGEVPEYTVRFVQLFIIFVLSESFSQPLITSILATGDIRNYQIVVGGFKLLNLPLSYLFLRLGFSPYVISQGMLFLRFLFLKEKIKMSATMFVIKVYINILKVSTTSIVIAYLSIKYLPSTFLWLFPKGIIVTFITGLSIFFLGCSSSERSFILKHIRIIKNRII